MTYSADGHRGTVYYGRAKPAGALAGDLWITWVHKPTPGKPYNVENIVSVWDEGWQPLGQPPPPDPVDVHDQRWPWCTRRDEHSHTDQLGGPHLVDGKPAGPMLDLTEQWQSWVDHEDITGRGRRGAWWWRWGRRP